MHDVREYEKHWSPIEAGLSRFNSDTRYFCGLHDAPRRGVPAWVWLVLIGAGLVIGGLAL